MNATVTTTRISPKNILYATDFSPRMARNANRAENGGVFDVQAFLHSAGVARKVVESESKETVFTQGDPATSVLYIAKGSVRLTVVNEAGKERVVATLGRGDFFGEGCLAEQAQRESTAVTITPSTILVIEKAEMIRLLHAEQALSDKFINHLVSSKIRIEEELVDHFFNKAEKRLARTLLQMAHYGKQDKPEKMIPGMSQEMLAEMIGTTRSRVNCFMNKFRKLGFIEYGGRSPWVQINESFIGVMED
jgi:CRP/FNR family transcriptional regulator, cyclic AMP receptor protein